MKAGRIVAVIVGVLVMLPALGLFLGGGVLTVAHVIEQEDDGYFDVTLDRLNSATAAIITSDVDMRADPGPPDWLLDLVDASVRIRATGVGDPSSDVFIGIGPTVDVENYLSGVARDEIRDVDSDGDVRYRTIAGADSVAAPVGLGFWVASASGDGTQELEWDLEEGEWTAALLNADGSPGILTDVTVGVRSGALLGIGIGMFILGAVLLSIAIVIIVLAARGHVTEAVPAEAASGAGVAPTALEEPVRLEAEIDEPLSPWLWLVKWFLAIPHFIVLAFLWVAFVVLTMVAGVAILFTGRYPRGIFDFNVGVMRWTWRVVYYAASGGLGTDRYPPFSTEPLADYPARLDIAYPGQLSQGLVLVKWWLLAIPHYLVIGFIAGSGYGWWEPGPWSGGLVGILVLIAAVTLLFTGRYPRSLFDFIIGLNRWVFRVLAYASLMTDRYPPFRLDQGGRETEADQSFMEDSGSPSAVTKT
jgi:hypothetical protein